MSWIIHMNELAPLQVLIKPLKDIWKAVAKFVKSIPEIHQVTLKT